MSKELFDPADRRYRYPYINCTNCGHVHGFLALPYDRPNTTMRRWPLDDYCAAEYRDPDNRRSMRNPLPAQPADLLTTCSRVAKTFTEAPKVSVGQPNSCETEASSRSRGLGGYHLVSTPQTPLLSQTCVNAISLKKSPSRLWQETWKSRVS